MVTRCLLTYYVNILQLSAHPAGSGAGAGRPGLPVEGCAPNCSEHLKNN